jgi:hypothetical protein
MFLPNILGVALFVISVVNSGALIDSAFYFGLLFLVAIPFRQSYTALFPNEPHRFFEARFGPSVALFLGQLLFWAMLYSVLGNMRSGNGF